MFGYSAAADIENIEEDQLNTPIVMEYSRTKICFILIIDRKFDSR